MGNLVFDSVYFKEFIELADLSLNTKKAYKFPLKGLGEFIKNFGYDDEVLDFDKFYYSEADNEYEPIDLEFVDAYVEYLKETKTKSGLGNHFSAVKSFFRFLEGIDLIQDNPFSKYPTSFHYRALKNRALSQEESDNMLMAGALLDPFTLQWFVLVLLEFSCGLRSRELRSLRLSQINFDLNVIYVDRNQKNDANSVEMQPALAKYLSKYIEHPYFKAWLGEDIDKELFFLRNKPLTKQTLNKLIGEIAYKANIDRKVTSHDLRATMAYLMYMDGISLRAIQRQMRHSKQSTTLIYLPMKNRFVT